MQSSAVYSRQNQQLPLLLSYSSFFCCFLSEKHVLFLRISANLHQQRQRSRYEVVSYVKTAINSEHSLAALTAKECSEATSLPLLHYITEDFGSYER